MNKANPSSKAAARKLGFAALSPAYVLLAAACASVPAALLYPPTRQADVVDDYFGTKVADPYRWLEDLDSAETRAWVEAQNRVSQPLLRALPAREAIRARLAELWNYERYGVPQRTPDGTLLFTLHDGVRNQPLLYAQAPDGARRVVLDPNGWSADGTEALVDWKVSPDGRHLAYAVQSGGTDWVEYRVLELATGRTLPDRVGRINFNFDFSRIFWRGGDAGFFYSRFPDPPVGSPGAPPAVTNQKLYYHRLGTEQKDDVLVYERPDQPKWFVWGEVTDDGRYLLIYVERSEDTEKEIYVKDLRDPARPRLGAPPRPLVRGFDANYYYAGSDGPVVYFRTSHRAPRYRIVAFDLRRPDPAQWRREVVPESADVLHDARVLGGEFVVSALHDASSRLLRYSVRGQRLGEIALPGLGTAAGLAGRPDRAELFYGFTSFTRPFAVYRHDLQSGAGEAFHPPQLRFDPAAYVTELLFFASKDGTRVPLFLSRRQDLDPRQAARTLLYGYGGFAISQTPAFSVPNLVWMERGGLYAQVCLRGGGEYGEAWHRGGMLEKKQNVFDDFVAAAEFLVRERYTTPARLAVRGRSNGGLLMGAVVNQRPDLFGAVNAGVGLFDMLRYHRFGIAHAWAGDYGTADDPQGFAVLRAYSPAHNVPPAGPLPAVLVTTADHDDRVHPLHSFKYTAALQAAQRAPRPVVIRIETRAGHGVGTALSKQIEENADVFAFLEQYTTEINRVGVD